MKLVTMDVHSDVCTAGVFHGKGAQVFPIGEYSIKTSVPHLKDFFNSLPGHHTLILEEGPLSPWLKRTLEPMVKKFIVTNPRKNKLIYADADKDDFVDLKNLATIYVTNTYDEVYHTDDHGRQKFKDQVLHYHDHNKTITAVKSKIKAVYRSCGIRIKGDTLYAQSQRQYWLKQISAELSPCVLEDLYLLLDTITEIKKNSLKRLQQIGKKYDCIKHFNEVPGVGPVVASSFFAIIDTPWRFKTIKSAYRYCGLAVVYKSSNGRWLSRPGLNKDCNHILKRMMLTAARNCRFGDNKLSEYYHYHLRRGLTEAAALNQTARKIVQILMSMWKHETHFDPEKVQI